MAKSPKKPAAAKPAKAKSADANKSKPVGPSKRDVKKAVGVEKLAAVEQGIYSAKEDDIDLALHRCLSHFGDLQPSEVQVVIKLLKPYFERYGAHSTTGGLSVR